MERLAAQAEERGDRTIVAPSAVQVHNDPVDIGQTIAVFAGSVLAGGGHGARCGGDCRNREWQDAGASHHPPSHVCRYPTALHLSSLWYAPLI